MIRAIEISFAQSVPRSDEWLEGVHAVCRVAGACTLDVTQDGTGIGLVVARFGEPVNLPEGLDHSLTILADVACKAYERANPTRVMWPCGIGYKPRWSQRDAAFLGVGAEPGAPEGGEPTFDDDVFAISCEEREDLHGRNPLNPEGARLRAVVEAARAQRRAAEAALTDWGYRRGLRDGGAIVFNAVMAHESNAGRGMDLFLQLKEAADDALAAGIIRQDPDQQPLWEHLIQEALGEFEARTSGTEPFKASEDTQHAFKSAVRAMLARKLSAPDSENMRLREALARVHRAAGDHTEPSAPLNRLLAARMPDVIRFVDMPRPLQDALLAYVNRPTDAEGTAVVRAVLGAYLVNDTRTCTCHPDDNPPRPCPRKFALSECRAAADSQ